MEPQKVRALVSATPEKLEGVAKRMEVPLPVARDIRVQAMNLILGRCVLCGRATLAGMCRGCRRAAPQRRMLPWSSVGLLKLLDPSDQLIRQACDRCNKPFMLSAGYLLRRLLSGKTEDTKRTCNSCIEAEKEAKRLAGKKQAEDERRRQIEAQRRATEQRRREQKRKAEAQEPTTRDFLDMRSGPLSHQPFAHHEGLQKLKNQLLETPKRCKSEKRPKRAKYVKNQTISR